jgi:hypothetical protein
LGAPAAAPKTVGPLGGDRLLARAVAAPHLSSYSVPVHMSVHIRTPIGIRAQVEATAYVRAPAQAALVIKRASGLAGAFFKGAYKIDLVPQAWPASYRVIGTTRAVVDGATVVQVHAQPRAGAGEVQAVTFTLATPSLQPIAAEWQYAGGGSIRLAYVNGRTGAYTLPLQATIAVDMPHDKLDADGTYGSYALNVPVPAAIFSAAK